VTGLQYLRAHWYDPSTARFINEDKVEGELTNPLSLNLYTYVENNPLIYVDSSGYGKRPANNTLEGMGLGSGSASGGRMTPGGSMGGGGGRGGSGSSGSKPSTSGKVSGSLNGLTNAEKKVVNDLINSGKNVEIIPKDPYSKVKTPDFKVNGIKTELKTLENANINTGITRIQKGLKQGADTVIIDARAAGLTVDQAKEIIKRASGTYSNKTIPGKVEIWTNEGNITYP
jgi:RHS repeat-associated protein